ncbi:hypothetical protein BB561_004965 [Smittium simulii]|uniref:Palmitoyltransferase n=1 Tax=Smittium simulii TaxID=133385 RepID=A0A2T9YD27_9FUNG|nr:hypothetical protein BB561_004965 [Smittium simulii]
MLTWSYFATLSRSPGYPVGLLESVKLRLWGEAHNVLHYDSIKAQLFAIEHQIKQQTVAGPESQNENEDTSFLLRSISQEENVNNRKTLIVSINNASSSQDNNMLITICLKCKKVKPPRAHHCSICNRCVMKMDHLHVYLILTNSTTIENIERCSRNTDQSLYDFNQYDMGYRENLTMVFGPNILLWLVPTDTT